MPLTLSECTPGLAVKCPTGRGMDSDDIPSVFQFEGTDLIGLVLTTDWEAVLVYWGNSVASAIDNGVPQVLWHKAEFLERHTEQFQNPAGKVQELYAEFGVKTAEDLAAQAYQRAIHRQQSRESSYLN